MLLLGSTRTAVAKLCRVSAKLKVFSDNHTPQNRMASNQRQTVATAAAADGSSSMPTPAAAIDFLMLLSKLKVSESVPYQYNFESVQS
jgi:hypothetical protein